MKTVIGTLSPVAETPDKWLRPVLRPVLRVVELSRVPVDLVEQLAHADRVASWARTSGLEGAALGIGHVGQVVWRVEVLAIPASGKS